VVGQIPIEITGSIKRCETKAEPGFGLRVRHIYRPFGANHTPRHSFDGQWKVLYRGRVVNRGD